MPKNPWDDAPIVQKKENKNPWDDAPIVLSAVKKKGETEKSEHSTIESSTVSEPLAKSGQGVNEDDYSLKNQIQPTAKTQNYNDITKPSISENVTGMDQVVGKSEDMPTYQKETLAPFGKGIVEGVKSNQLAREDALNLATEKKSKLIDIYENEYKKTIQEPVNLDPVLTGQETTSTEKPQIIGSKAIINESPLNISGVSMAENKDKTSTLQKTGSLIGGVMEDVAGAAALSTIPIVGVPLSVGAIAIKQGIQGAGSEFRRSYIQSRSEGLDQEESYKNAQIASGVGAVTNSIEGALGAITGVGGKYVGKVISEPLKRIFATSIVDNGIDATVAAGMQVVRNLNDQFSGLKTKLSEGVSETAMSEFIMGQGINTISSINEVASAIKSKNEVKVESTPKPKANKVDIENRNTIIADSPQATQTLVETSIENSPQIVQERLRQNANESKSKPTATEPITNDAVVEAQTPSVPTEIPTPTDQPTADMGGVGASVESPLQEQQNTTPISEGLPVSEGQESSNEPNVLPSVESSEGAGSVDQEENKSLLTPELQKEFEYKKDTDEFDNKEYDENDFIEDKVKETIDSARNEERELSDTEVSFLNEYSYRPKGYDFDKNASLVKSDKEIINNSDIKKTGSKNVKLLPKDKSVPKKVKVGKVKPNKSDFSKFESLVNDSKTEEEAFEKVKKIQGVSSGEAKLFRDKYDPKGELSAKEAFSKFYNEVKGQTQTEASKKDTTEPIKDVDGVQINAGDKVSTQQQGAGTLPSGEPVIGIAEETTDAFGKKSLQIRYRKQGKDYDQFILLDGKINKVITEPITDTKEQSKTEPLAEPKQEEPKKLKGKYAIAEGIAMFARISGVTKSAVPTEGDSLSNATRLVAKGISDELGYTGQKLIDAVKKYLSDAGIDKKQIETAILESEEIIKKEHPDPISKWQKTFRVFTGTFNPKEELKTYQKMTGESLSADAAKLIEEKSPEYVFNALQSIADNKPIAITEDERVHLVAAGALIAQGLDTEHRTLLENNETEKAQEALDLRNKIVENISYLGTKSGQLIKALDLKWLSSFSDPQSVVDAFSKGLARHIAENRDSKSGKVKTYDKIVEKAAKIIAKATEKSKTEKVGKSKSTPKEKGESFSSLRGKTKLRGKDLIADASENLAEFFKVTLMADGNSNKIDPVRELTRIGVGLIDEAKQKGIDITNEIHEKIKDYVQKNFGKGDIYDKYRDEVNNALFPKSQEGKNIEKREKEVNRLEKVLKDLVDRKEKKAKESIKDDPEIQTIKAKISLEREAIKAEKNSETIKEVSDDINSTAKDAEQTTKDFQQKLNRLIDTDEDFKVLHKELMDDLKDLGVKDDKTLNKKAREILALIYLGGKGKDGVVQTAIASAINGTSVNTQAIVQATLLAQQATSYPANSIKRSTLMGQSLQTIANTQPIDMMQVLLNANYASMLSRPLTYYSIVESSVIESQAQKNRFSRIPLLGFLTPKGKLLGEIGNNKVIGNLAKANLMNAMINGDMRLNSMYSRSMDKGSLSNFMQSSPLERSWYGRLLNAPLRIMGTLDAGFTPAMDKKNAAAVMFTTLRNDPNNKNKTDSELLSETKKGLKIFDEQKVAAAELKAEGEGFKKGKLPNFFSMAKNYGKVAIGKSKETFTKDQRDAMDYHIRVNEILEQDLDLEILDQAENLTNNGLMRLGRKFTIDLGNGKTKEVSSPTTYIYEKVDEFNKYLEEQFKQSGNIVGKGAYGTARGLTNLAAPFMKTVMSGISRATDSTPGLGAVKYFIHRGTVRASKNAQNTLELQKILHRQYVGVATMATGILLDNLLSPSDDEEEFKKQPFAFAVTGQLSGLDKATKGAWQNKVGKQQLVIFRNGEVVYQLGYQNWNIKMALDANSAIAGFMKRKDEIVKENGEDFFNNRLSDVGVYVASIGSSLFSSTYNPVMSSFYDTLLEASVEQDPSIITDKLQKSFASTPGNVASLAIPWSGALKQIDGILNGYKPSRDVASQMWNSFPMTRTAGAVTGNELVKPKLDMFGDPITVYPSEGANPFTPLAKVYKPIYTPDKREQAMRDHLLFNHAIPSEIKTNQVAIDGQMYDIDTDKLTYNTTKKFKNQVFKTEFSDGSTMYDYIMSQKGEGLSDYINKEFKEILAEERVKLGQKAKEEIEK